jgi:hypothetical protein
MGLTPDAIDEVGGRSRPLVEIPLPLSDKVAMMVIAACFVGTVPMIIGIAFYIDPKFYIDPNTPLLRPWPVLILGIVLLATLASARRCLTLASRPVLAIEKDGLRMRSGRSELHFDWDEVNYCRWSQFGAGILNIQTQGHPESPAAWAPRTRHFYRVPKPYRPAVETAIRALGNWADGDPGPAPDRSAPRADAPAEAKAAAVDRDDGTPVPTIEIPRRRWRIVASILGASLAYAWIGLYVWANLHAGGAQAARRPPAPLWFDVLLIGFFALIMPPAILAWAKLPEFAVRKDGLRLPYGRHRDPFQFPPWDYGLIAWDDVGYCRWSRFEPGVLQVQARATRTVSGLEVPQARLTYRVPEPHRPAVETAIRAMGKWAD